MAHEVTLDISTKFVLHKDVKVDVKKDGKKLGTALISKGNIEWFRKLPLIPHTSEVELSGIFRARRFHEKVQVQRVADRLDPQAG